MRIYSVNSLQYTQNKHNVICLKAESGNSDKVSFCSGSKPSSKFVEGVFTQVFESGNIEKASGFMLANSSKFLETIHIIKGKIQAQAQFLKEEDNIVIIRRLELAEKCKALFSEKQIIAKKEILKRLENEGFEAELKRLEGNENLKKIISVPKMGAGAVEELRKALSENNKFEDLVEILSNPLYSNKKIVHFAQTALGNIIEKSKTSRDLQTFELIMKMLEEKQNHLRNNLRVHEDINEFVYERNSRPYRNTISQKLELISNLLDNTQGTSLGQDVICKKPVPVLSEV